MNEIKKKKKSCVRWKSCGPEGYQVGVEQEFLVGGVTIRSSCNLSFLFAYQQK